ncbi:MAG: SPFH domain-containing protein [Thermoflexales bacterium]|nr:SPFH domain-containing protein [Thermoflexales bacterium]
MTSIYDIVIAWLQLAGLTALLAAGLGYILDRLMGAASMVVLAGMACLLCLVGALWGPFGLFIAIALVTALAAGLGRTLSEGRRGMLFLSSMWVGWCILCWWGYQVGGTVGLILITLPAVALFWIDAFGMTQELLPLGSSPTLADRMQAFHALLTYSLGRNYPYSAIEKRRTTTRVPGNVQRPFFFAGPGIIMTSCDQAVVTSNRLTIKDVKAPGFSFTGLYETITHVVDLRVQQRSLDVNALTKDGIRVNVTAMVSFRIQSGQTQPELGKPWPFDKESILSAVRYGQPVEHVQETVGGVTVASRQQHAWEDMVVIVAEQAIRRIIGEYAFDALYAPYELGKQPRQEINQDLEQQVRDELEPIGIQVVSSRIGNMVPVDDEPAQQRIGNWQAEWDRKMAAEMGKGEAEYIRMVEAARAQAQVEMIRTISEGIERSGETDPNIAAKVVAMRFIEAMEKMVEIPAVQQALPPTSAETVQALRRSIERQAD